MSRRLVSFLGHLCAVAIAAAAVLIVTVPPASSDRPVSSIGQPGQAWMALIVQALAPVVRLTDGFLGGEDVETTSPLVTPASLYTGDDIMPPSILRVDVDGDGRAVLSGRATPGVQVALLNTTGLMARATVTPAGRWAVRIDRALVQGDHNVKSVAVVPGRQGQVPGQTVRLAVPQKIPPDNSRSHAARDNRSLGNKTAVRANAKAEADVAETGVRFAQAGTVDHQRDGRQSREQTEHLPTLISPVFDWLQRSSEVYDDVIVGDLSGRRLGLPFVIGGSEALRDQDRNRDRRSSQGVQDEGEQRPTSERYLTDIFRTRWHNFNVGLREWFRQAQESYQDNVVEELSVGERISRDTYVRKEPVEDDGVWSPRTTEPVQPVSPTEPEPDIEITRGELKEWPVEGKIPPRKPKSDVAIDWPIAREDEVPLPLPEVRPDPEKEALIRRAEQQAEEARELARRAAEQAERARQETEALLAEERRLQQAAEARAAQDRAARQADLRRRGESIEEQAESERKRAAEATARARQLEEEQKAAQAAEAKRQAAEAQRKAAEELAEAANEAADREFAAGRVAEPPTSAPETDRSQSDFSVAEAPRDRRRLSFKDSAGDDGIEEGSTLGDIDDSHPSVRKIYDTGEVVPKKAKRRYARTKKASSRRKIRRRAYKRRAWKRSSYRKKRARKRRAYKTRRYYRHRVHTRRTRRARLFWRGPRVTRTVRRYTKIRVRSRLVCGSIFRPRVFRKRARWRRRSR